MEIKQNNTDKRGEFAAFVNNVQAGLMTYTWAGKDKFIIDHTEVEPDHKGEGVGKEMVYKAVAFARENGFKIMPLCPFAHAVFDKNAEIGDVRW
ncbi:GNAT family N-acetyltransferase [Flavobacterium sp.]|uniref:GNAT family N-acetyltransferase n=1 Tax=Flavobacterium sp. TaxID=239 RepID=UPI001210B0C5|nr:GNAT family N-acetyltransferase [Flavobacterium sp.]RZJ73046.1 MAG: N-acetyltransferase [Flavobacterium sp.]